MNSVREEIPDTKQGLNNYINYSLKSLKDIKNHIKRLQRRIQWCYEKAEKRGWILNVREDDIDRKNK